MLGAERQSAWMSKITNDGLTRSGTGYSSCTHMTTVGVKGLSCVLLHTLQDVGSAVSGGCMNYTMSTRELT